MPTLSYDLHLHPGPSAAPRWGDGARVWEAAAAAGVRGFVWKAHETHTVVHCRALPDDPVLPIASASLNPWAGIADITEAVDAGASWIWGPTQNAQGATGWELPLPRDWPDLAQWLNRFERPIVLATGHLGASGRAAFARLCTRHPHAICSITHSLYVPLDEAKRLAASGCIFEVDAFTYTTEITGRIRADLAIHLDALLGEGALVYFTSDGGQASTGNPFSFGARVLDQIADVIGTDQAIALGVENPAALIQRLETTVDP
jgi:hypothetical protein